MLYPQNNVHFLSWGALTSAFFVGVNMDRAKLILVGLLLVSFAILIGMIKYSNSRISDLERDIDSRSAEIERLNTIINEFSGYQKRSDEAAKDHVIRVDNAGVELFEKIQEIESNDDACDWLDQPLPVCVQEQFNAETGFGSGYNNAASNTVETMRKTDSE